MLHRITLAGCRVDLTTGEIVYDDRTGARLTASERRLLAWLARHPREVVPRSVLLQRVWGYHARVVSRTVDTTMRRLRRKVEAEPRSPSCLLTVHGVGYRFVPPDAAVRSGPHGGGRCGLARARPASPATPQERPVPDA